MTLSLQKKMDLSSNMFVLLDKKVHDRSSFSCGEEKVDTFLKNLAAKNMSQGMSKTYVMVDDNSRNESSLKRIKCFYSFAMTTMKKDDLLGAKRLPPNPIPVLLIPYLGVDEDFQGKGLFSIILNEALDRATDVLLGPINFFAVVLDPMTISLEKTYLKRDFQKLVENESPSRLFFPARHLINRRKEIDKIKQQQSENKIVNLF